MYNKDIQSNGFGQDPFPGIHIYRTGRQDTRVDHGNLDESQPPGGDTILSAEVKDGKIVATYSGVSYVDSSTPVSDIKEQLSQLDTPIPVGFGEFNNTIYFDGAEYSEFV